MMRQQTPKDCTDGTRKSQIKEDARPVSTADFNAASELAGETGDFLEAYMAFTDGQPTTELYRMWAGIAAVAGALERRVYVQLNRRVLYPNLYTLLVGPPGTGKTVAIDPTADLWRGASAFHLAPKRMTRASMLDALSEAGQIHQLPGGLGLLEYHSMLIASSELGNLMSMYDLDLLSAFSDIYDTPSEFSERLRHSNSGKTKDILAPQINMLAGAQPMFLAHLLPEEAWGQGFTSRIIMIYASQCPAPNLFGDIDPRTDLRLRLDSMIREMARIMGRFDWEPSAAAELQRWASARCPPEPMHSRLAYYNSRRPLHISKLAMVASISRSRSDLCIRLEDLTRAKDWLLEAELLMPDIFREMSQRSDAQIIQELHLFLWELYAKRKQPVPQTTLVNFLSARAPLEKIRLILEVAERANIICREAGTELYTPRHKKDHGIE